MSTLAPRLGQAARQWGWLLLLALAPVYLAANPRLAPALLALPALLAAMVVGASSSSRRTPLDWPILLLMLMVLVSLWATFSIVYSLPKITGLLFGVGLYYAWVARGRQSLRALAGLTALHLAFGVALAGVGLLGINWSAKIPILTALTARLPAMNFSLPGAENGLSPNGVAGVLLWVAPPACALSAAAWLNFGRLVRAHGRAAATTAALLLTFVALGATAVLVLSQSRGALLGLAVALGLIPLVTLWNALWPRPSAAQPIQRPRYLTLVALVFTAAILLGCALLAVWFVAAAGDPASVDPWGSLGARFVIWPRAIQAIQDFPFTGVGLDAFRRLVNTLYPIFNLSPDIDIAHAHNTWLQVALDVGLPGLVAYLAMWIVTLVMLFQTLRRAAHPGLRALALGLLGALAGAFVYGLTDTIALGSRPGFMWWTLLALATLVWIRSRLDLNPGAVV